MTLLKRAIQLSVIAVLIGGLFCCGKFKVKPSQDIDPAYFKSAIELKSAIRRGEITSVELLNLYLDRIQRYNDDINAVVALDINDVLLATVSPTVAFPHDHEGTILSRNLEINGQEKPMLNNMTWTRIAVVSGLPATAAPVGLSESGLPVGIQIIGARLEDRTTIDFAGGLSELIGGFVAPPGYED